MKKRLAAGALSALLILAVQARGEADSHVAAANDPALDWSAWTRPAGAAAPSAATAVADAAEAVPPEEIDVVDAHWMALTMWGEGRGEGEAGMRAIGHVIRNRWQAKRHGAFVTDTVSAAWQFSCWNPDDPNREMMLNIEALPKDGADHRLWLAARRLSAEILSGRSDDPTRGALFYHTAAVQPAWSRGIAPVAQIGQHLFFRTAA